MAVDEPGNMIFMIVDPACPFFFFFKIHITTLTPALAVLGFHTSLCYNRIASFTFKGLPYIYIDVTLHSHRLPFWFYIYIFFFFRSVSDAHFIYFSPNGNSLPGVPFYHCISIWDSSLWVSFFPLSRLFSSQSTHRQVAPRVLSQRSSCSIRFIFWLCLPRLAPIFWDNMFLLFWLALFCRCKNVIKDLVLLYACG